MNEIISIDDLVIGYGTKTLLEKFSLKVKKGEFLSIVGSNGSGKTTLIKTILGLIPPIAGKISCAPSVRFGYVSQRSTTQLHFPLTVEQVVMLGRVKRIGLLRWPSKEDKLRVDRVLDDMGITPLKKTHIQSLSGGQYQRMLIARALASEPNVLVFDEPTTGMDIVAEANFLSLVKSIREKFELTVIMVTHDLSTAAEASQNLILINSGDKTVGIGTPTDLITDEKLSRLFHKKINVARSGAKISISIESEK